MRMRAYAEFCAAPKGTRVIVVVAQDFNTVLLDRLDRSKSSGSG